MVRPRKIYRQNIVDIAVIEYWLHGINNVSISKIAKIANVSRPGIYVEFKNEDLLKASALKHYINFWDNASIKKYNDFKKYPNNLLEHFKIIMNYKNYPKLYEISSDNSAQKLTEIKGCLVRNSALIINQLGPISQKVIKDYDNYRITQFKKYIKNMQNEKIFNKHINVNSYAKYISIQFDILQTMINRGNTKTDIVNYLNTALIPLVNKDKIDAYKIV